VFTKERREKMAWEKLNSHLKDVREIADEKYERGEISYEERAKIVLNALVDGVWDTIEDCKEKRE
jgi:hypothetical protein